MQAAKNALADIQDKHKDIMRLEQVQHGPRQAGLASEEEDEAR